MSTSLVEITSIILWCEIVTIVLTTIFAGILLWLLAQDMGPEDRE